MPQLEAQSLESLGTGHKVGAPKRKDQIDSLGGAAAGTWGENGAWKNKGRDRPTLAQMNIGAHSGALWEGPAKQHGQVSSGAELRMRQGWGRVMVGGGRGVC